MNQMKWSIIFFQIKELEIQVLLSFPQLRKFFKNIKGNAVNAMKAIQGSNIFVGMTYIHMKFPISNRPKISNKDLIPV